MKSFWIVYLAVAVVGSGVVWLTAPLARSHMSELMKKNEPPAIANIIPTQGVEEFTSQREGASEASAALAPSSLQTVPSKTNSREDSPALLGIFRAAGNGKPEWGVVRKKTNFYDEEGKRLGEVPAGLIIQFIESRKSSKGTMVYCKFQYKGRIHGPYLVKRVDMNLFTGNYADLSENQRNNLESYYKVRGLLEERKIEIMREIAQRNPHYVQYKALYDKYMDHIEQAKTLTAERDAATGLKRSAIDDKLRRMKNEEVVIEREYKEIHTTYKAWKTANNSDQPDSTTDPQTREYRLEMRRLAALIPGLAY